MLTMRTQRAFNTCSVACQVSDLKRILQFVWCAAAQGGASQQRVDPGVGDVFRRGLCWEVVKWKAHPWYDFVVSACVRWCTRILTAVLPLRYVMCWAECCFIPTTCHVEPVIGNLLGYLCVDTARKGWKNCCCPEFLSSANYVVLSPIYLCVQLLHDCELCSK